VPLEPNRRLMDGASRLFLAAQEGHAHLLAYLEHPRLSSSPPPPSSDTSCRIFNLSAGDVFVDDHMDSAEEPADVNLSRGDGMTVLHKAVEKGHEEVVEELLRLGADPNLVPSRYRFGTALVLTAHSMMSCRIASMLRNAGVDCLARTAQGDYDAAEVAVRLCNAVFVAFARDDVRNDLLREFVE
jgi:hypothetical protein